MIHIKVGDIVTCENGHQLYRAAMDLETDSPFLAPGQFIALHEVLTNPVRMEKYPPCPFCSSAWIKWTDRTYVHFKDGWRPRKP